MTRLCPSCHKEKPLKDFTLYKATHKTKSGSYKYARYSYACKPCMSKRTAKWRKANRARYLKYQQDYHKKT